MNGLLRLQESESKTLEYNRDISSLQPIMKTVVAFANTAGGTLIIGVGSDKKIVGVKNVLKAEEALKNAINDCIAPAILPEFEIVTVEKKDLIIVKVSRWRAPFYMKKEGVPRGVYIRLGSSSRPAGVRIVEELRRSVANSSYDQQPFSHLGRDALEEVCLGGLDDKKLCSLGVLAKGARGLVPTIGGLILFGKEKIRSEIVPDARVRCARFQGTSKAELIDRYEVAGTVLDAIKRVPQFIRRHTKMRAEFGLMTRLDRPEYPTEALREILVNALVHADYSITGTPIQVAIFEDRLEIQNPGMLPFGFTMDDLRSGVSKVRNKVLARVFHKLGLMEEWGSGYQRVMEACDRGGYPQPHWEEFGTTMRVTLFSGVMRASLAREVESEGDLLTEREEMILELVGARRLPFRQIFNELPVSISERMLRYELASLKKRGLLRTRGRGPATVWERV